MKRHRVGIVLFEDIEVLDFSGPFEVFSVTRINEAKRREEPSPFEVVLIAERPGPVTTTGRMRVIPDYTFETCPRLEIMVTPGGWGIRRELTNRVMIEWLRTRAAQTDIVAAVCTGSMLLGSAGLLNGLHATTHWRSLDWMRESFPSVAVEYGKHFVEDGKVLTSAGISAGIDMSLRVVARYFGENIARATARHMEYPYPENDARRIQI
jgi:transcriptional regulator GlxA family with amidase domain